MPCMPQEFEDGDSYEVRPRAPKRARRAPASPPKRPTPQQSPSGELCGPCPALQFAGSR